MPILALRGMVIRVAGDGRRLGIRWDGTLSTAAISECRRYKLRTEAMLERICEAQRFGSDISSIEVSLLDPFCSSLDIYDIELNSWIQGNIDVVNTRMIFI